MIVVRANLLLARTRGRQGASAAGRRESVHGGSRAASMRRDARVEYSRPATGAGSIGGEPSG